MNTKNWNGGDSVEVVIFRQLGIEADNRQIVSHTDNMLTVTAF
jgi:hypothetical protein